MIKKIAAFSIGSLFLLAPLVTSADTISDLQARIQALLAQIHSLQSLVNQAAPTPPLSFTSLSDDFGSGNTNTGVYCPKLSTTIQRGNSDQTTHGQVTELQKFLTDFYNLDQSVILGGFYGAATQNYVIRFQKEHGLSQSGIVGRLTRSVIASVCGGTPTTPPVAPPPPIPPIPPTPATRSATVDDHQTFHSSTFTLSGNAQNTATVVLALIPYPSYQGSVDFNVINSAAAVASGVFLGTANATNNRWSETFSGIPNGSYTLIVYDLTTHFILVSNGTVVVDTAQTTPPVVPPPPPVVPPPPPPTATTSVPVPCPVFQLPLCTGGTFVPQGNDAHGCALAPKCVLNAAAPSCTVTYSQSSIVKDAGTTLTVTVTAQNATGRSYKMYDSSGHQFFSSGSINLNFSAPDTSFNDLNLGTYTRVDTVTGSLGVGTCTASLNVTAAPTAVPQPCPVYQQPLCPTGQHNVVGTPTINSAGCPVPSYSCVVDTPTPVTVPVFPIVLPTCSLSGHTTTIADANACVSWCTSLRQGGFSNGLISGFCVFKSSAGVSTTVASAADSSANLANALTALESLLQEMLTALK